MKNIIKIVIVLINIAPFTGIHAQDQFILFKNVNFRKLEIYDQDNTKKAGIASKPGRIFWDADVSPDSKNISYIERDPDDKLPNSFKIITPNGNVLHDVNEDVRRYKWSNSTDKIALVIGKYRENDLGFLPEKIIIYDVNKSKKEIVNGLPDNCRPSRAEWSQDDSILYIQTFHFGMYEYNLNDKSLKKSTHKWNLSPDGKYYYREYNPMVEINFAVYNIKTNEEVMIDSMISVRNDSTHDNEYGELVGWAPGKNHVLLYKKVIEDIKTKDHVIPRSDTADKRVIILKDFISRKLICVKYRFFDVELNKEINELVTNGEEKDFITSRKSLIYKEKGNNKFKKLKF